MAYRSEFDHYVYKGTDVLRNLANIRDGTTLERFESASTLYRQACLSSKPIVGNFDLSHLKAIHRWLFQDVFDWAGEIRTINISKGGTMFGSHHFIENYSASVFRKLAKERDSWRNTPERIDLPARLAEYLGEINALHPFREGNGRTQRIFIGQLAAGHGLKIRWDQMRQHQMVQASISSFVGDNRELAFLIREHSER